MRLSAKISGLFGLTLFILFLGGCKSNHSTSIAEDTNVIDEIKDDKDPETSNVVVNDKEADKDEIVYDSASTISTEDKSFSEETSDFEEESDLEEVAVTKSAMIRKGEVSRISSPSPKMVEGLSGETGPVKGDPIPTKDPIAGQITAAEWNDLNNWDKWNELLVNQDYNEMQTHWQIFPRSRYSVFVKNEYELPLQDVRVELLNQTGKVIWSAKTDNSGKAELWADVNIRKKSFEVVSARVIVNKKPYIIENLRTVHEGVNLLEVKQECRTSKNVDIVFAVDATGSMGDEIKYLQSELKDVISRSLASNSNLTIRMGAVFYRDSTDEYVTRVQPLSNRPDETLSFIGAQSANGGGDYPEAVDDALEEALAQDWSEEAIARIIFLVLDAPPHHNDQILNKIQQQVADAAKEGIKIIPITASGINRQTEFLMKFMAIVTNGTYVFITDHSGIGNPHLEPVVKDYEVEKLNDLLVRLLYNYTKSNGCNANEPMTEGIKIFPNPAADHFNITTDKPIRMLKVMSNSGKLLSARPDIATGDTRIDLTGLIDGVYTVQCIGDGIEFTQPLVLISGK